MGHMITLLDTALHSYDCPTCGAEQGHYCPKEPLCLDRLHLASKDVNVIEAMVDSLMTSDPYVNRDAVTNQEFA